MSEILDRAAAAAAHQTLAHQTLVAYQMGILQQGVKQVLEDDDVITQRKCENWHRHICSHASMYEHARYVNYVCIL